MEANNKEKSKLKFAYVNFHTQPWVKDQNHKLLKYKAFFDYIYFLKDHFEIYVIDHIGVSGTFVKDGIRFQYIKKSNNKLTIPWDTFLRLRKIDPDVIYIQGLSFPHYIILLKWCLRSTTKILVHDHANFAPDGWKVKIYKWADSYIDTYFFTSKYLASDWIDKGIISPYKKIIECVEGSSQFSYDPSINKTENSFLWVGRLDDNKDPLTILRAFSEYVRMDSTATLTLFYEHTSLLQELIQFIKVSNMQNNIQLKGAVPNEDLEKWYQKSQYFILGSHKEGGPISLVEAMACGCIPIVTKIPAFKMMTDEGNCGFLFEPGNSKQLLDILKNLNNTDIETIRKNVLIKFDKDLSHQSISNKITESVYSPDGSSK